MRKEFQLSGVDMIALLGPGDIYLDMIQKEFPVTLTVRGDNVIIDGENAELSRIEELFYEMTQTLGRKGSLKKKDILDLMNVIKADVTTHAEGPDQVIHFGLKGAIIPRTEGQKTYAESVRKNDIVFSIGPAGTGKTFLAVAFAVAALSKKQVDKIVLCRPAVEAGENLGFLPGDLKEKVDPYLTPLYDALGIMMPQSKLNPFLSSNIIEIIPLAYMRGRTLDNSFLILDEAQNSTIMQMKMFLTRLGINSKAIVTGDITQIDLPKEKHSGLVQVVDLLKNIDGISFATLDEQDVVRHKLVKDIIHAYSNHDNGA